MNFKIKLIRILKFLRLLNKEILSYLKNLLKNHFFTSVKILSILSCVVFLFIVLKMVSPLSGENKRYNDWVSNKETVQIPLNSFTVNYNPETGEETETEIETETTKAETKPLVTKETTTKITTKITTSTASKWKSLGTYKITAYCPCSKCCGSYAHNKPMDKNGNPIIITASGTIATANRTVGVNPKQIPYGSILLIDGKEYIAEDTGTFSGKLIDMYFDTHEEAEDFGREYTEIFILV